MIIQEVAVSDLKFDPRNARKHSTRNLDAIKKSLDEFGQRKPIIVTKDHVVVAGNGQLSAAIELEWKTINVVFIPDDWSDDQIKAFAIADNRSAELAEWDGEILLDTLKELQEIDLALLAGFTDVDIKALEQIYGGIPERDEPYENSNDGSKSDLVTITISINAELKITWDDYWETLEGSDTMKIRQILTEMGY